MRFFSEAGMEVTQHLRGSILPQRLEMYVLSNKLALFFWTRSGNLDKIYFVAFLHKGQKCKNVHLFLELELRIVKINVVAFHLKGQKGAFVVTNLLLILDLE